MKTRSILYIEIVGNNSWFVDSDGQIITSGLWFIDYCQLFLLLDHFYTFYKKQRLAIKFCFSDVNIQTS